MKRLANDRELTARQSPTRYSSPYVQARLGAVATIAAICLSGAAQGQLIPDWVTTHASHAVFQPVAFAMDSAGASYIIATVEPAPGDSKIAVIKFDAAGVFRWQREFAGPGGQDIAVDVVVSFDGDAVYVIGRSNVPNHSSDYAIIQYAATDGSKRWLRYFNGPGSSTDDPRDAAATPDGGVVFTGGVWNGGERLDYATVKYDAAGALVWSRTYTGDGRFLFNDDRGDKIALTPQGDVVLGVDPFGIDRQWFVARYDGLSGAQTWLSLRDPGFDEAPAALYIDAAGDIYVTGATDADGDDGNFNENLIVMSFAGQSGEFRWQASFGDPGYNEADFGYDLRVLDDVLLVAGSSRSLSGSILNADAMLLKYDSATGALLDVGNVDSTEPGGPIRSDSFLQLSAGDFSLRAGGVSSGDVGVQPKLLLAEYPLESNPVTGDVDGDGHVTLTDLAMLLSAFGSCIGDAAYIAAADFDASGCVELSDLAVSLGRFGS